MGTAGKFYPLPVRARPGVERHALDLVDLVEGVATEPSLDRRRLGDAGQLLDAQARAAYRHRLEELREAMDDAEAASDEEHSERIQAEAHALVPRGTFPADLEDAERYTGVALIDPAVLLLPPVAWHERTDPGAQQLAWLTRSHWLCRRSP